ncbi:MAG: hypothetical protein PHI41_08385 [Erysipelotrichaceae bacterium]|nr:hypothetical protein [Erysipelotrichaceae bacterium]
MRENSGFRNDFNRIIEQTDFAKGDDRPVSGRELFRGNFILVDDTKRGLVAVADGFELVAGQGPWKMILPLLWTYDNGTPYG